MRETIKSHISKQALFNFVQRLDERYFQETENAGLLDEAAMNIHLVINNKIASDERLEMLLLKGFKLNSFVRKDLLVKAI